MPHSMPFDEQKNRWFAVLLIAGLPLFVIYKWLKGDLPYVDQKINRGKEIDT